MQTFYFIHIYYIIFEFSCFLSCCIFQILLKRLKCSLFDFAEFFPFFSILFFNYFFSCLLLYLLLFLPLFRYFFSSSSSSILPLSCGWRRRKRATLGVVLSVSCLSPTVFLMMLWSHTSTLTWKTAKYNTHTQLISSWLYCVTLWTHSTCLSWVMQQEVWVQFISQEFEFNVRNVFRFESFKPVICH